MYVASITVFGFLGYKPEISVEDARCVPWRLRAPILLSTPFPRTMTVWRAGHTVTNELGLSFKVLSKNDDGIFLEIKSE